MKRLFSSIGVIMGMGLSIATAVHGYVENHDHTSTSKSGTFLGHLVVRPELTDSIAAGKVGIVEFGSSSQIKIDRKSKAIRVIYDPSTPLPKDVELASLNDICLGFVSSHQEYFGRVTLKQLELDKDALLLNDEMQFLKYRVYYKGIPVQDASVDCRFKMGRLVQVINHSFSEAKEELGSPRKGLQSLVKNAFQVSNASHRGQVYRVLPDTSGYKLVLADVFRITKDSEPFDVQIITNSGKILEQRPLNHYLAGKVEAQIYNRWWQEDLVDTGIAKAHVETDAGTVFSDARGRFEVGEASSPKLVGFKGPQVDVRAVTGELVVIDAALNQDIYSIQLRRETDSEPYEGKLTSQAMIFHHTNLIVDRARQYLSNEWFNRPLIANANLGRSCNAHWDGTTINFYSSGNNCANTGLISDVVYHEWGHGLDAHTGGIEDGALSEGFGDIMSLIFTHSNILGIGFRTDGSEVRDLEPDRIYPDDANQEVHAEGLIIASTFWDLWKALLAEHGEEIADELLARYSFNMIVAASRYTDVYEALKVIDDNDGNLGNGTPNLCLINEVFRAHGLAGEEAACILGEIEVVQSEVSGNGNGLIEPGEQIKFDVSLINTTNVEQISVVGSATVASQSNGIVVTQADLDFGNIAVGETANSSTSVVLNVENETACGTTFDVVYDLHSPVRQAKFKKSYLVGRKLVGGATLVTAIDLPLPIRDKSNTSTALVFEGDDWLPQTPVHAAHLKFDISHSYRGDIIVTLINPSGDIYPIYQGSGFGSDVHFDQDISPIIAGALGRGEWRLNVYDRYSSDEGTLDAVELTLTAASFLCEQ